MIVLLWSDAICLYKCLLCIVYIINHQRTKYVRQVENDNFHYSIEYYTVRYLMNYISLISFAIFIYYIKVY